MWLRGTEEISIEVEGLLEAPFVCAAAAPLVLTDEVSILALTMRGLGIENAPLLPRFDYREVLWRVGATLEGSPVWLAVRCDLDRFAIRKMAAATIRYPVVRSSIAIEESGVESDAATMRVKLGEAIEDVRPPRRTFVVSRDVLYEIPWDEIPAPRRWRADVKVARADVFGPRVQWNARGLVHRGRTHRCGAARVFYKRHPTR